MEETKIKGELWALYEEAKKVKDTKMALMILDRLKAWYDQPQKST